MVLPERLVRLAQQEQPELQVQKAQPEQLAPLVLQVQQALLA